MEDFFLLTAKALLYPRTIRGFYNTIKTPLLAVLSFGGEGWIRTIEADSNRFTVCSLWPLGNLSKVELVIGIEPTTC